ncbi:MAG: sigma-70 family RNA polymerase sigma factor [Lachnospiraceae bacterium]|nr:sigma-70 family RNA polymerase sigma factor [Lachnospiraceae bacterium]
MTEETVAEQYIGEENNEPSSNDSCRQYLKEISKIPLLTKEEEYDLAVRARKGDKDARLQLVESNLRLVVSIARKHSFQNGQLPDLIQEGNMGLIDATRSFDPTLGNRFSTYATLRIEQKIRRYVENNANPIRIPLSAQWDRQKIFKAMSELKTEAGAEPRIEEIAEKVGMTADKIKRLLQSPEVSRSIDEPVSGEKDVLLGEMIKDVTNRSPEEISEAQDLQNIVLWMLSKLTEKERFVIENRFGLNGHERLTLEKIGAALNLSKEAVRQIEKKAIKKLEQISGKKEIEVYI